MSTQAGLAGPGPRELYERGLHELEIFTGVTDPRAGSAHALGAISYFLAALARADPAVQEDKPEPRPARPEPPGAMAVISFLAGLDDVMKLSAGEAAAVDRVMELLHEDPAARDA